MIFVKNQAKANTSKIEGTTQTYGQLISLSNSRLSSNNTGLGQTAASSPHDVLVKIIPNTKEDSPGERIVLNDIDRSKIAIAAYSDTKDPSVALNKDVDDRSNQRINQSPNTTEHRENQLDYATVIGSVLKNRDEIQRILTDARKVDMMITLKSKESEILEFNNLKEIEPDANFTYNFFEDNEEDISSQENQALDPLLTKSALDVPRYVKLTWDSITVTEVVEDPAQQNNSRVENKRIRQFKDEIFRQKKGVLGYDSSNFKNSFEKSKKQISLLNSNGVNVEVNDVHNLDNAMNSTSNSRVFTNSISAVFNINDSKNVIANLPILVRK